MDRGEGRTKYLLTGEGAGTVFVIDEATGNIHVTKSLDREEKAQYVLLAQAVDRASNRPLEPPSEFIIKVQDINDNPPIFPLGPYHATVPEMSNVGEYPRSGHPRVPLPPFPHCFLPPYPSAFRTHLLQFSPAHAWVPLICSSSPLGSVLAEWGAGTLCRDISDPGDCSRRR